MVTTNRETDENGEVKKVAYPRIFNKPVKKPLVIKSGKRYKKTLKKVSKELRDYPFFNEIKKKKLQRRVIRNALQTIIVRKKKKRNRW